MLKKSLRLWFIMRGAFFMWLHAKALFLIFYESPFVQFFLQLQCVIFIAVSRHSCSKDHFKPLYSIKLFNLSVNWSQLIFACGNDMKPQRFLLSLFLVILCHWFQCTYLTILSYVALMFLSAVLITNLIIFGLLVSWPKIT